MHVPDIFPCVQMATKEIIAQDNATYSMPGLNTPSEKSIIVQSSERPWLMGPLVL